MCECLICNNIGEVLGFFGSIIASVVALWIASKQMQKDKFSKKYGIFKELKKIFANIDELFEYQGGVYRLVLEKKEKLEELLSELNDFKFDVDIYFSKKFCELDEYIREIRPYAGDYGKNTLKDYTKQKLKADELRDKFLMSLDDELHNAYSALDI